jgi:glycosyltransferase involved in cell wall biosynthesis
MKTLLIKANTIIKPKFGGEKYISGVGRSTLLLLKSLAQIHNLPFDIKLYASGLNSIGFPTDPLPFKHFSFWLPQKIGTVMTSIEPDYIYHFVKKDLIHIPHNFDVVNRKDTFTVTIHDTCLYDIAVKEDDKYMQDLWIRSARNSAGIITCSEYSKSDIMDRFNVDSDKISVVPWGISTNIFHKLKNSYVMSRLSELKIRRPYFVSVSCSKERKNMRNLLKAYRLYHSTSNEPAALILLWDTPPIDIFKEYSKEINDNDIIFMHAVSDQDLVVLYNGALGTLFPSRYEGFGFPILESFACETPVMTCRNSSLQEVGGELALYTGEDDIDTMVDIMKNLYENKYDKDEFVSKTKPFIQRFSWDKTAENYVSFFQKYL